eukprot:3442546-Pyramimonas_sp.AAC.1
MIARRAVHSAISFNIVSARASRAVNVYEGRKTSCDSAAKAWARHGNQNCTVALGADWGRGFLEKKM